MTVDLATLGGRQFDLGLPGQDADQGPQVNDSFVNTATTNGIDSAGMIDFGVAVAKGTTDNSCKPVDSNSDVCIGISTRWPIVPGTPPTPVVGWRSGRACSVKRIGSLFAIPYENVTRDDAVIAIVAQGGKLGGLTGGAIGTGRLLVTGARWATTTTAGQVGRIEVIGREVTNTSS